jgi:uncharacterized protein
MILNDSHIHFFSPGFFATLAQQKGVAPAAAIASLGWDDPVSPAALADRWVAEFDRHGVTRAALMASLPGDARSVAQALGRHPDRFVGYFMLDPTQDGALSYATSALGAGLRTVCLFPAMHHYALTDPRVEAVFKLAASPTSPTSPIFVHCGELSVGVRGKLGLPSPFDMSLGVPTHLIAVAQKHPAVPIIIPHFGAGRLDEALALATACPNVYLDSSSSNSWIERAGLTLPGVFQRVLDTIGPERILFGTDSSFFPRGWNREVYERQKAALDVIGASAEAQAKIFGGNFQRLFP